MKKIVFFTAFVLFFLGCANPEKQAQKIINNGRVIDCFRWSNNQENYLTIALETKINQNKYFISTITQGTDLIIEISEVRKTQKKWIARKIFYGNMSPKLKQALGNKIAEYFALAHSRGK